jgi:hypothetical protein
MGTFSIIRPKDDSSACQASDWADRLDADFRTFGHSLTRDIDDTTPADATNVLGVFGGLVNLICYFGHGNEDSLLTKGLPTVDKASISLTPGVAVVSVACKTGTNLGPAAITAGANAWLGFTIKVPVIAPHRTIDTIGDAVFDGLKGLGNGDTMQQALDALRQSFDDLVTKYDSGSYRSHPASPIGYYSAMALRDHVVLHGNGKCAPL